MRQLAGELNGSSKSYRRRKSYANLADVDEDEIVEEMDGETGSVGNKQKNYSPLTNNNKEQVIVFHSNHTEESLSPRDDELSKGQYPLNIKFVRW